MSQTPIVRPSGCVVYTDVVMKQFPTWEEAQRAYRRHMDNPGVAADILFCRDNTFIMPKGVSFAASFAEVLPLIKQVWNNVPSRVVFEDMKTTSKDYIAYVLRDSKLPAFFQAEVMSRVRLLDVALPNVAQVHGDFTSDNILLFTEPMKSTEARLIDFSVRRELNYWEADTSKFKFHYFRNRVYNGLKDLTLTPLEEFFFACHFCRVWTRDVEDRPNIEERHAAWLQKGLQG